MSIFRSLALGATALVLMVGTALADPYVQVITPTVEAAATNGTHDSAFNVGTGLPNFADTQSAGQYWGQEVANTSARFDTNQLTIDRSNYNQISFTMQTAFNGNDAITNPNATVRYADLFFTERGTPTPDNPNGAWAFGIGLGGNITGGGTGQQLNGGVAAGVYAIDSGADYNTSDQIWNSRTGYAYGGFVAQDSAVNAAIGDGQTENPGHNVGDACATAGTDCVGAWNNTVVGHTAGAACTSTSGAGCVGDWTDTVVGHTSGGACSPNGGNCVKGKWNNTVVGHTSGTVCTGTASDCGYAWTTTVVGHTSGTSCDVTSTNCTGLKWTTADAGHTTPIPEIEPPVQLTSAAQLLNGFTVDVTRTLAGTDLWSTDSILHSAGASCAGTADPTCAGTWTNTVLSHTAGTACTSTSGTGCVGDWTDTVVGHTVGGACSPNGGNCVKGKWNNTVIGHTAGTVCTGSATDCGYTWTTTVVGHTAGTACSDIISSSCGSMKWTTTVYNHHAGDACSTLGNGCVDLEWDGADGIHAAGTSCYVASTHCITFYDLTVTVMGGQVALNDLFNNFDVLWGTGDCSNDPIWGSANIATVPTPGTIFLLGLGFIGLAVNRRRMTTMVRRGVNR